MQKSVFPLSLYHRSLRMQLFWARGAQGCLPVTVDTMAHRHATGKRTVILTSVIHVALYSRNERDMPRHHATSRKKTG